MQAKENRRSLARWKLIRLSHAYCVMAHLRLLLCASLIDVNEWISYGCENKISYTSEPIKRKKLQLPKGPLNAFVSITRANWLYNYLGLIVIKPSVSTVYSLYYDKFTDIQCKWPAGCNRFLHGRQDFCAHYLPALIVSWHTAEHAQDRIS